MATMRGQGATEYIVMFAVVVIIAIIVAGVLGGFPALHSGTGDRESAAYWATAPVAITRSHVSTDPSRTVLSFRNNNNYPIFVDRATFAGIELVIGRTLSPGMDVDVSGGSVLACPVAGARYYYNVTIYYDDVETGSSLTLHGERQLIGLCEQ